MSDLFEDLNTLFKRDFFPVLEKYLKNSNNKITDNFNDFLNDPRIRLTDFFEKFSKNKDNDINQCNYNDIENISDIDASLNDEYDDLLKRLISIEEKMIQLEKILKEKN